MLLKLFGAKRVALGSDYPFPLGEAHPGKLIESMKEFSDEGEDATAFRNCARIPWDLDLGSAGWQPRFSVSVPRSNLNSLNITLHRCAHPLHLMSNRPEIVKDRLKQ